MFHNSPMIYIAKEKASQVKHIHMYRFYILECYCQRSIDVDANFVEL